MAITYEQIIETAEALLEQNINPTLAAVRQELGGGSFTTISEALKGWKEKRAKEQARAEVIQVPTKVQEAMSQAAITVWTEATQHHAAQLAAEREALESERARLEGERQEAIELADQVSRELEQVQTKVERMEEELEFERQTSAKDRTAAAVVQAQAEERRDRIRAMNEELLQARDSEREAHNQTTEAEIKIKSQADKIRAQNKTLKKAENHASTETLRADRAEALKKNTEQQMTDLEHEISELRQEAKTSGSELARVTAEHDAVKRERNQAQAQAAEAQERERAALDAAAELRGKLAALNTSTSKKNKT